MSLFRIQSQFHQQTAIIRKMVLSRMLTVEEAKVKMHEALDDIVDDEMFRMEEQIKQVPIPKEFLDEEHEQ
jgi:hypothetical protein